MKLSNYVNEEVLYFKNGIFGFETYKNFLALPIEEGNIDILSLQSVDDDQISFLIMNPFKLDGGYDPKLTQEDFESVDATKEEELAYYVICVMNEQVDKITVNMKCPVVVNAIKKTGAQIILNSDEYKIRQSLSEYKNKGE